MADIQNIQQAQKLAQQMVGKQALSSDLLNEFNSIFKEASAMAANNDSNAWLVKERQKNKPLATETMSLDRIDKASIAQLTQGVVQNANNANPQDMNIVPLQIFLDNAIRSLENVSRQEFRVNDLMDGFVKGEVSEDEVVLETAKLNLAVSTVTTIVQSAVQTFKEIQQIPV